MPMNRKILLQIEGMHCAACAARIQKATSRLDVVKAISVSLAQNEAVLELVEDAPRDDALRLVTARIDSLGFKSKVADRANTVAHWNASLAKDAKHLRAAGRRLAAVIVLGVLLAFFSMGSMFGWLRLSPPLSGSIQGVLAAAILGLSREILASGLKNLVFARPDMNTLVALGAATAFAYSLYALAAMFLGHGHPHLDFETSGLLLAFISTGRYLEERSKKKARDAIGELVELNPVKARRLKDGLAREVRVEELETGDTVLVASQESCPADGLVASGRSEMETSLLSGESYPQEVGPGDRVYAGSMNLGQPIAVTVTRTQDESLLAEIIETVREAQASKPALAGLADTVSCYFIPAVLLMGLGAFLAWLFFSDLGFERSLLVGISVIVCSCPCAMGLATPISVMVASNVAARRGFVIRNATSFEAASAVGAVLFDKTGTLTTGSPAVASVSSETLRAEEVLRIAASLEKHSKHPLAKALTQANASPLYDGETEILPQEGVRGVLEGKPYALGNEAMLTSLGLAKPQGGPAPLARTLYLVSQGEILATIAFSESLREGARETIEAFKALGIRTMLLSGDEPQNVRLVAQSLGMTDWQAGMRPQDKLETVRRLQAEGLKVAMIGDGVNDAPALAQADLSMSVMNETKLSSQASDVVLLTGRIATVLDVFRLSRATVRNIRENLFWAFIYNIIGIPVAMGVLRAFGGPFLDPVWAAAAMGMSSLFVVGNALRLNNFK